MSRQLYPLLSTHNDTQGGITIPPYVVPEVPLGFVKPLRIITAGAGASGINMIRTLRLSLPGPFEHVVYEKNPAVGGTWYENRYPGCRCDVPSMNYQFSWRKKLDWGNLCAGAEEIREYLEEIVRDEGMGETIKLGHRIVEARWVETEKMWEITVEHEGQRFVDKANVFIDATGILNQYKFPDIPNLDLFKGQLVHTANWPENLDISGKKTIVIGNGASGVQVLPYVTEHAASITHIIRSPTWILPPRVAMMRMGPLGPLIDKIEMDAQDNFSSEQIARFQTDPALYDMFADALDRDMHVKFAVSLIDNSPQEKWAANKCREFMTMMLGGNEDLCKALIPEFPISCKRLTPAPGYLEAFRRPNVYLETSGITGVTEKSLVIGDKVVEADVVVCATGFETSFRPAFPIVGRRGNLQEVWAREIPKSYMSIGIEGMPNFFKFLGPNTPIAHGSVFTLSEHIATYISKALTKLQTTTVVSLVPSPDAIADYHEHVTAFLPRTAWAGPCSSWYKHPTGAIIGLHPGSRLHFMEMLKEFRGEDWEYEYAGGGGRGRGNRFGYLGNGFTVGEIKGLKEAEKVMKEAEKTRTGTEVEKGGKDGEVVEGSAPLPPKV